MRYNKTEKRVWAELRELAGGRSYCLAPRRWKHCCDRKDRTSWEAYAFLNADTCAMSDGKTALQAVRNLKAKIEAQHVGA